MNQDAFVRSQSVCARDWSFEVEGRRYGGARPCLLAAEIGINHNGDVELARRMIDAAVAAGADAVKFQSYRTHEFLSDRALSYSYVSQGRAITEPQWDMFERCELAAEALAELRTHALARGALFFATPTSERGVDELAGLGCGLVKNGSDCLGNLSLVRAMAHSGMTTVLSTGMATLAEIDAAVRAFRSAGGSELVLLHCTSSYPTPDADVNLRRIPVLGAAFGCPSGLSDHSAGCSAALGAVALGACLIEKHFTLDRGLPGPDQRFSSDPREFAELARGVRALEQQLGSPAIGPTAGEEFARAGFRLSCVAAAALPAGTRLEPSHVVLRRPGTGLPPSAHEFLIGKRLVRAAAAGEPLTLEHIA
jgi:N-acetylneuraminate synthase/N,N'-diacetyllegionaminate synthase